MTEKKPGEPDERDREKARSFASPWFEGSNPTVRGYEQESLVQSFAVAISEARRGGAREALERAAEIIKPHVKCDCRGTASSFSDSRSVGQEHWGDCLLRIYDAIRALADQPEAEGKSEIRHTIAKKLRAAFALEAPAKADALPLGKDDGT